MIEILECDENWRPRARRIENFASIEEYVIWSKRECGYVGEHMGEQGDAFSGIRQKWLFSMPNLQRRRLLREIESEIEIEVQT